MKKIIFIIIAVMALFIVPYLSFASDLESVSYLAGMALALPEALDVIVDYVANESCGTIKAEDMNVDELQNLFYDRQFSEFLILKFKRDADQEYQIKLKALCISPADAGTAYKKKG